MAGTSLTAIADATALHNERQVLAVRALESERRVAVVRLLSFALSSISQGLVAPLLGQRVTDMSVPRIVAVAVYALYSVVTAVVVFRAVAARPRMARVMPLVMTTIDVAFVLVMQWSDARQGHAELAPTAASLALIVGYAILRLGAESLVYSTVLAVVGFTYTIVSAGVFSGPSFMLGAFIYVALGVLLYATRRAMRAAFVDLKRRDMLTRLVPAKVADEIIAGRMHALGAARRDVTVLFSDVRGFTTFSEGRQPEAVLAFLDDYFGRMTQVVQGHDGSVNKFIGDGLLAIWGAPQALDDHPVRAVKAALDMQKVMAELNEHRERDGEPPLQIGIGVHSGTVAAGMLGAGAQSEYSVIGDAVNLASRIEGLTKEAGAMLLVSDATWQRCAGKFDGEQLGEFAVKGRKEKVVLWAVKGVVAKK